MAEIRWFGHNCFRIRSREAVVITDPVGKRTGYSMSKQTADIVTISHQHEGHINTAQIKPEFVVLDGPGEYELHGVFVYGFRTFHDASKGSEEGYNTIFSMIMDGMRFTHLCDLGAMPSTEVIEELEATDVLLAPAGGGPIMSPAQVAELVGVISPKLVIPMQFQTANGDASRGAVEEFARHLGMPMPEPVEKLALKSSDLADKMSFTVLSPSV